jgi:hypothetical protein
MLAAIDLRRSRYSINRPSRIRRSLLERVRASSPRTNGSSIERIWSRSIGMR